MKASISSLWRRQGDVIATGYVYGNNPVDFDPTSGGVFNLTNTGTEGTFIIKLLADKPPLANPDNYTTTAGATLVGGSVLTNDSEPAGVNNVPLTAHLIAGPSHAASFTLNADGTFSYTGGPPLRRHRQLHLRRRRLRGRLNPTTATITVDEAPVFTSLGSTTFIAGQLGSFTVTTAAYPVATYT